MNIKGILPPGRDNWDETIKYQVLNGIAYKLCSEKVRKRIDYIMTNIPKSSWPTIDFNKVTDYNDKYKTLYDPILKRLDKIIDKLK